MPDSEVLQTARTPDEENNQMLFYGNPKKCSACVLCMQPQNGRTHHLNAEVNTQVHDIHTGTDTVADISTYSNTQLYCLC